MDPALAVGFCLVSPRLIWSSMERYVSLLGLAKSNSGPMMSAVKTSFFCHKFNTRITRDFSSSGHLYK